MPLNLISDAWIPVRDQTGQRRLIAPWQMADATLSAPDWPRADLNIACLELLVGLVFMADPPNDLEDWLDRQAPDPDRLRERLAAFAPAFNLTGDGPLFLQDLEKLTGEPNPPDMLFIDSAGANTAKNNADLMVHRDRYPALDLATAAMALYTFQAHAPSGGAGNRTSMRGGGPLVTLVDPGRGLWPLVWANVPEGKSAKLSELPWMRPTRISDKGGEVVPTGKAIHVEAFFGMPRRLRLVEKSGAITGVVQKPWGTNYALWTHPLTPYYRQKAGAELLPVHPRAGVFGYRHWLGILAEAGPDGLRELARSLRDWRERGRETEHPASVIVAGWAMDNMKPRDFTWSVQPVVSLSHDGQVMLRGMIQAAEQATLALRSALGPVLAEGEAREAEREAFYVATEPAFLARLEALKAGEAVAEGWLSHLATQAVDQFKALALPGLDQRETDQIERIVQQWGFLTAAFRGFGSYGDKIFEALDLPKPEKAKKGKRHE